MKVTEDMITAYLETNTAYWTAMDNSPAPLAAFRTGSAREATKVSLKAALRKASVPPEWEARLATVVAERDAALAMCARLNDQAERAVQALGSASLQLKGLQPAAETHCPEKAKPGGCSLPNVQCGWPDCNKPSK